MNIRKIIGALLKHDIFAYALMGVVLRIVLMPFFIWPSDIVAQQFSLVGILNHYDPYSLSVSMYPPFIYILLYPFLLVASRAGFAFRFYLFPVTFKAGMVTEMITSSFGDPAFLVFWKVPLLVFDIFTGLLVYGLVKQLTTDTSKAKKGFILWFFNPLVLITSYVHGAFDVIAVFFILLGIYFLSNEKYLLSGISFGFGGITKISPFLIAIPLSALVFLTSKNESTRIFLRKRFANTAAFLAGCAIPILLSIFWNINYYHSLTASTLSELSINGGLNQWFFLANPNLTSSVLSPNLNILTDIFYLYPIISLIPLLLFRKVFRNSKINSYTILLFSALSLAIVYLVSPTTVQPQYILWLIPVLAVISLRNKSFYWPTATLSLAASAFFFSLQGPFAFMYPLALFTPLYSVNKLNAAIIGYANAPGVFCPLLREDLCLTFGAVGFFGLMLTILLIINALRKIDKDAEN